MKNRVGKLAITEEKPHFVDAKIYIAKYGRVAYERRRTDILMSCSTQNELHKEFDNIGYKLSRSAVNYHL